ncbi:hypothetical protein AB0J72_43385 [Dactylosporangium sp. NPDC049742]|uniref:hypothetical protein n=1 Tax=Dactylosporangium sp. NPDC049742 TaxID=3154737 RepID=UPI003420EBD5
MVRTRRLTVAALVALAVATLYASDPKHETTGDPNPTVALSNGDPIGPSGSDPVG